MDATQSNTPEVAVTPVVKTYNCEKVEGISIRSICRQAALDMQGKPAAEQKVIKDLALKQVKEFFPSSAAADKFGVHFAWHKKQLRKEGKLPQVVLTTSATNTDIVKAVGELA